MVRPTFLSTKKIKKIKKKKDRERKTRETRDRKTKRKERKERITTAEITKYMYTLHHQKQNQKLDIRQAPTYKESTWD